MKARCAVHLRPNTFHRCCFRLTIINPNTAVGGSNHMLLYSEDTEPRSRIRFGRPNGLGFRVRYSVHVDRATAAGPAGNIGQGQPRW